MKLEKSELLEHINNLNRKKPLKESKEIQRVSLPADADALEQHEEALKQNKERLDPKNYEEDVKSLIKDTASEESRYRHFDVVDRKDLAKRINEAKEKGLDFKVSRSTKEGFRYDLKVLNEDYLKKDAGNPDINCAAFNKATDIGNSLGEDVKVDEKEIADIPEDEDVKEDKIDYKKLVEDIMCWIINSEDSDSDVSLSDYLSDLGYDEELINSLFDSCKEDSTESTENSEKDFTDVEDEDIDIDDYPLVMQDDEADSEHPLDEELKIYTSSLAGFHPSLKAKDLWDEIVKKDKVETLENALEFLFPDGIKDEALDVFLSDEGDWIRDLIDLDKNETSSDDESNDEFDDTDVEDYSDEEEISADENTSDDEDIEPIADDEVDIDAEKEEKPEEKEIDSDKKYDKVEDEEKHDDKDDEITESLADGFLKKNFKENSSEESKEESVKKELVESDESEEDIVDISEDDVDNMLGCPKADKE